MTRLPRHIYDDTSTTTQLRLHIYDDTSTTTQLRLHIYDDAFTMTHPRDMAHLRINDPYFASHERKRRGPRENLLLSRRPTQELYT